MNWCEIITTSRERKQVAKTIMWSIAFVCCFWKYVLLLFFKKFIYLVHWVLVVGSCRVFITSCRIFDCAQTLVVAHGLSCSEACGILVLQPGIKPSVSLALQGRYLTTVPQGKSPFKYCIVPQLDMFIFNCTEKVWNLKKKKKSCNDCRDLWGDNGGRKAGFVMLIMISVRPIRTIFVFTWVNNSSSNNNNANPKMMLPICQMLF